MKKLFTGMGALLLSVMCLGVVTSANNDDISTQAIVGGGNEPCYITGPKNFSTTNGSGATFAIEAKDKSVSYVGIHVKITNGVITASNGSIRILNSQSGTKSFEHSASRLSCTYVFKASSKSAGYNATTFSVIKP